MKNYYSEKLNSNSLQKCYETAPSRIKQFLEAEIDFVLSEINNTDTILDLGCGYGRVAIKLVKKAQKVVGIDISKKNIELAKKIMYDHKNCELFIMDASKLKFPNNYFDKVFCLQNGISAFKVNPIELIKESIRVTKKGGSVFFSTYSPKFWKDRIEWFEIQARENLIGEIDYNLTKNGTIVCKDGFKAITYSEEELLELASNFNVKTSIIEIDNSSLFCKMTIN